MYQEVRHINLSSSPSVNVPGSEVNEVHNEAMKMKHEAKAKASEKLNITLK
jgi:hypothetical protein